MRILSFGSTLSAHKDVASGKSIRDLPRSETTMSTQQFAVCIKNPGYSASLELRKVYELLPDADARRLAMLRVIDESGEDYCFPKNSSP